MERVDGNINIYIPVSLLSVNRLAVVFVHDISNLMMRLKVLTYLLTHIFSYL